MPAPEQITAVVREWTAKAEADLKVAEHLLHENADWAVDAICFHAQQCVEKYLKALLVRENIDFPKTHDLEAVVALLPPPLRPKLSSDEQKVLTKCAIAVRYPGDFGSRSLQEAKELVEVARRIQEEISPLLPLSGQR